MTLFGYRSNWPEAPSSTTLQLVLAWAGICLVSLLLGANTLAIPLERDEGLFGYIGQTILGGGLPYRDVVDHKPPLGYYLYALALMFVPPTATGVHGFLLVYDFLTLLALSKLARALTGSRSVGLWTALSYAIISSLPAVQGFSASSEMLMLLPVTLGIYCAVVASGPHRARWAVRSGALGACALLTKQTGALFALFMASIVVCLPWLEPGPSQTRPRIAAVTGLAWLLGFLAPCAVVLAYFGYHHALTELFYWTVTYNSGYVRDLSLAGLWASPFPARIALTALPLLVVAVLAAIEQHGRLRWFLWGFLFVSLLALLPGHGYRHYFAQIAPALSLAAGVGLARLADRPSTPRLRSVLGMALAALVIVFPVAAEPKYYMTATPEELSRRFFGVNPFPEAVDVADYLAARTSPSERVFIFGSEAEILFYSKLRSLTPFALKYPLVGGWSDRENYYQKYVMRALEAAPPRYIIFIPLYASLTWNGLEPKTFPLHDRVREVLRAQYAVEAVMPLTLPKARILQNPIADSMFDTPPGATPPILIYRRL